MSGGLAICPAVGQCSGDGYSSMKVWLYPDYSLKTIGCRMGTVPVLSLSAMVAAALLYRCAVIAADRRCLQAKVTVKKHPARNPPLCLGG